jgi:ketosteroid isomerase-like protein
MVKYFPLVTVITVIFFACSDNHKQTATKDVSPVLTQHNKDERNKAIVLECIRAFAANDAELILSHNANNVVNIGAGQPIHGSDSTRILLQEEFKIIKDYKPSNQVAVADNNYVFVFQYVDLFYGNNPEKIHSKIVEIFKFNDEGKIIMHSGVNEVLGANDVKTPL